MGNLWSQVDVDTATQMINYAYDHGVNFFDNAEAYAGGQSEVIMGQAFRKLGLRRGSYLVSTKLFWGIHNGPNEKIHSIASICLKQSMAASNDLA